MRYVITQMSGGTQVMQSDVIYTDLASALKRAVNIASERILPSKSSSKDIMVGAPEYEGQIMKVYYRYGAKHYQCGDLNIYDYEVFKSKF